MSNAIALNDDYKFSYSDIVMDADGAAYKDSIKDFFKVVSVESLQTTISANSLVTISFTAPEVDGYVPIFISDFFVDNGESGKLSQRCGILGVSIDRDTRECTIQVRYVYRDGSASVAASVVAYIDIIYAKVLS